MCEVVLTVLMVIVCELDRLMHCRYIYDSIGSK